MMPLVVSSKTIVSTFTSLPFHLLYTQVLIRRRLHSSVSINSNLFIFNKEGQSNHPPPQFNTTTHSITNKYKNT